MSRLGRGLATGLLAGLVLAACGRPDGGPTRAITDSARRPAPARVAPPTTTTSTPPTTVPSVAAAGRALDVGYSASATSPAGRWEAVRIAGHDGLVWLPAEYGPPGSTPARPFPVVYLLHGEPGIYADWARGGWADAQADALLEAGRMPPAILVLPDLYGGYVKGDPGCRADAEAYLLGAAVPWVDAHYVTTGERAIGGLSDGGGCAVVWASRHPGVFRVAFSLAGYFPASPAPATGLGVLLEVGAADREARAETERAAALLGTEVRIELGHDHAWSSWARDLGFALPWALAHLADPWPARLAAPLDQVTLPRPAPLPNGFRRVGRAPTRLRG